MFGKDRYPPHNHRNSSPNPFSYKEKGKCAGWSSPSLILERGSELSFFEQQIQFDRKVIKNLSIYMLIQRFKLARK